jgi:hypothetical protein
MGTTQNQHNGYKTKQQNQVMVVMWMAYVMGMLFLFKEKNTDKNLRITATYCLDFRKNILSVKRLQLAGFTVAFDEEEATGQDKKTGIIAFVCKQGSDGMFYLRGERQHINGENAATFLATEIEGAWKDVQESVDEKGKMIKNPKLPRPMKMCINKVHL